MDFYILVFLPKHTRNDKNLQHFFYCYYILLRVSNKSVLEVIDIQIFRKQKKNRSVSHVSLKPVQKTNIGINAPWTLHSLVYTIIWNFEIILVYFWICYHTDIDVQANSETYQRKKNSRKQIYRKINTSADNLDIHLLTFYGKPRKEILRNQRSRFNKGWPVQNSNPLTSNYLSKRTYQQWTLV